MFCLGFAVQDGVQDTLGLHMESNGRDLEILSKPRPFYSI